MKPLIFKPSLALLCGALFPSISDAATYLRNTTPGDWAVVTEWDDDSVASPAFAESTVLPGTGDTVILNQDKVTDVTTAIGAVGDIQISDTSGGTFLSTTLNIASGGSLEPTGLLTVGAGSDTGTLNVLAGGTLTATGGISIGEDASHSLNIMGGTVTSPTGLSLAGGSLNLSSGTLTLTDPAPGGGTFEVMNAGSVGVLNITGGDFLVDGATGASDRMALLGEINISGGSFSTVDGQTYGLTGTVFNIIGDDATFNVARFNHGATDRAAEINFEFDETGVTPITCANYMRLQSVTVNVDGSNYTGGPGVITLIAATNTAGQSPATATITAPFPGLNSAISLDTTTGLVVTLTVPGTDWDGSDDMTWNGPTDATSWSGDTYANGDSATFGDIGFGTVTITGTVEPGSVVVNNTAGNDYIFSGAPIAGTTGLSKSGDGNLTLASANTYTGLTSILGGRLTVTDAASLGSVAGNTEVANGAAVSIEGGITVAESLSLIGRGDSTNSGALRSDGNNTVSGAIILDSKGRIETVDGTGKLILTGGITGSGNSLVGDIQVDSLIDIGSNDINLSGSGVTFDGAGFDIGNVIDLNVAGNTWGSARLAFDGSVRLGANDAIATDSAMTFGFGAVDQSTAQLDLNGFDQTLASIATDTLGVGGDVNITGGGTLTVNQDTDTEYQGRITDGATSTALVKDGTGILVLNNLSGTPTSYTGDTTVLNGTLVLNSPDLADSSTVTIGPDGTLQLDHSAVDVVGSLNISGTVLPAGTYNAGNSNGFITGSGAIQIGGGSVFDGWAAGFLPDLTDSTISLDFDGGGLRTGIEYVVGGDPTDGADDSSLAPASSHTGSALEFDFRRTDLSESDQDTLITVEYGSDLSGWETAIHGTNGVTITVTDDDYGTGIDRVVVSLPDGLAVDGKIFARLNVATAP